MEFNTDSYVYVYVLTYFDGEFSGPIGVFSNLSAAVDTAQRISMENYEVYINSENLKRNGDRSWSLDTDEEGNTSYLIEQMNIQD